MEEESKNKGSSQWTQDRLLEIVSLAEKAGEAIMVVYQKKDFGTTYKEDQSPLTEADMAAHYVIMDGLKTLTPELPALSEESKSVSYTLRRAWEAYWLIDPLDGTKEFVKRSDQFTVNIALVKSGVPVLGVVHAPALNLTYYGAKNLGVFKKVIGKKAVPISVSDDRSRVLKIAGSLSHGKEALEAFLKKIGPHELVRMGSSLKLCLVAEGAVDFYPRFGRTMEWDTAAAQAIVTEAGGSVTDASGKSLQYNKPDLANPHFFVRGTRKMPLLKDLSS